MEQNKLEFQPGNDIETKSERGLAPEDINQQYDKCLQRIGDQIADYEQKIQKNNLNARDFDYIAESYAETDNLISMFEKKEDYDRAQQLQSKLASLKQIVNQAADACAESLEHRHGQGNIIRFTIASVYENVGNFEMADKYRKPIEGSSINEEGRLRDVRDGIKAAA